MPGHRLWWRRREMLLSLGLMEHRVKADKGGCFTTDLWEYQGIVAEKFRGIVVRDCRDITAVVAAASPLRAAGSTSLGIRRMLWLGCTISLYEALRS